MIELTAMTLDELKAARVAAADEVKNIDMKLGNLMDRKHTLDERIGHINEDIEHLESHKYAFKVDQLVEGNHTGIRLYVKRMWRVPDNKPHVNTYGLGLKDKGEEVLVVSENEIKAVLTESGEETYSIGYTKSCLGD